MFENGKTISLRLPEEYYGLISRNSLSWKQLRGSGELFVDVAGDGALLEYPAVVAFDRAGERFVPHPWLEEVRHHLEMAGWPKPSVKCWNCGGKPVDLGATAEYTLEAAGVEEGRMSRGTKWRAASVFVPQCRRCGGAEKDKLKWEEFSGAKRELLFVQVGLAVSFLVGLAGVIGICLCVLQKLVPGKVFAMSLMGALVGSVSAFFAKFMTREARAKHDLLRAEVEHMVIAGGAPSMEKRSVEDFPLVQQWKSMTEGTAGGRVHTTLSR
jgi:hypothetical protein